VYADYKTVFGAEPGAVQGIGVMSRRVTHRLSSSRIMTTLCYYARSNTLQCMPRSTQKQKRERASHFSAPETGSRWSFFSFPSFVKYSTS
jgi:hypothetical protein